MELERTGLTRHRQLIYARSAGRPSEQTGKGDDTRKFGPPFVKDPNKSIAQLIKETDAAVGGGLAVLGFARFVLGEGVKESTEETTN